MRSWRIIQAVLLVLLVGSTAMVWIMYPHDVRSVTRQFDHVTARRENAALVTLCRNNDLRDMLQTIESVESKFNSRFNYDWIFLNNEDWDPEFKSRVSEAVSGKALFGTLDSEEWGYPDWIDLDRAKETRRKMKKMNVRYGELESYHHMCRFFSGPFFEHPYLRRLKYYWRVEPAITLECKIKNDPFAFMRLNNMTYGFTVAPKDIPETIPGLWNATQGFLREHPNAVHPNSLQGFLTDDDGQTYNTCHFWTNFEIADLDFWRTKLYKQYFDWLDHEGGFYYERWGDAPVHSIAASLFLDKKQIHFFNEIGYFHDPYGHCPWDQGLMELECDCKAEQNEYNDRFYDWHQNSCLRNYFSAKGSKFHDPNPPKNKASE